MAAGYGVGVDSVAWARELARALLADALPGRWAHVQGAASRAGTIASMFGSDGELLVSAALLHDIGYSPALIDTGFHPVDGARYLRKMGASDRLVDLVAHHSCAMLEAELRGMAADLAEFTDERTPLRDALWWADMTTTPDGGPTTMDERVAEIQRRYGPDDVVSRFIRRARPELAGAVARTEDRISRAGLDQE